MLQACKLRSFCLDFCYYKSPVTIVPSQGFCVWRRYVPDGTIVVGSEAIM